MSPACLVRVAGVSCRPPNRVYRPSSYEREEKSEVAVKAGDPSGGITSAPVVRRDVKGAGNQPDWGARRA